MALTNESRGGQVEPAANFLFLPNLYAFIQCSATVEITYLDAQKVELQAEFVLTRDFASDPQALTIRDSWKTQFYPSGYEDAGIHPIVGFAAPGGTQFSPHDEDILLRPVQEYVSSRTHWIVAAPFQRPYVHQSSDITDVGYIFVKNLFLFAPLRFGSTYTARATLYHTGADYDGAEYIDNVVGAIFPYGSVEVTRTRHSAPPGMNTKIVSYDSVGPGIDDSYPGEKGDNGLSAVFCSPNQALLIGNITNRDPQAISSPFKEQGPLSVLTRTRYGYGDGSELTASVLAPDRVFNATLVSKLRIYSGDAACPVHICLTNLDDRGRRVDVDIVEQTRGLEWSDAITVPARSERELPLELAGLRGTDPGEGSLLVTVTESGSVIHRERQSIDLLPADHLLLRIHDAASQRYFRTVPVVVCWVTPHAKSIEEWTRDATKFMPSGSLPGGQAPAKPQVHALWKVLEERGVTYVDRSYSIGTTEESVHQRVQVPTRTLELGSGNCIDLTVLFASALEQLSMRPTIILVPGHAFVGWASAGTDGTFLETTMLGTAPFDEAVQRANQEHEDAKVHFDTDSEHHYRKLDVVKLRSEGLTPLF